MTWKTIIILLSSIFILGVVGIIVFIISIKQEREQEKQKKCKHCFTNKLDCDKWCFHD